MAPRKDKEVQQRPSARRLPLWPSLFGPLEDLPRYELAASASTSTYALTMQVGESTMESMLPGQQGQALGDARTEELHRLAMTQQYIIGELSLWLARLQATAPSEEAACEFARLRLETEAAPLEALPNMALRALDLARGLCRDSLARGDLRALTHQATMAAELREFAVAANLLVED